MEFDFEDDDSWAASYPMHHSDQAVASSQASLTAASADAKGATSLGAQAVGFDARAELPGEELFVSRRASLRVRGYRELEDAFRGGHSEAWKFFPWFREMLMDSDDAAFASACTAVAEHYRGAEVCPSRQVAPLTWLRVLSERLLRVDTAASDAAAAAAADLVAAVLENHNSNVRTEISALIQDSQTATAALRLLCVCSEQGICCADEVLPFLVDAARASPLFFSDASLQPQLEALYNILPSLPGKLSLRQRAHVDASRPFEVLASQSLKLPDRPSTASAALEASTPPRSTRPSSTPSAESPALHAPPLSPPRKTTSELSVPVVQSSSGQAAGSLAPSSTVQHGWDWDNRLAASPVLPKADKGPGEVNWDVLHVLSAASPRSWRERLECLQAIDNTDSDGLHGQALLPQLVLQSEDNHPSVCVAALHAISRVAMHIDCIGDFLAERLAAAIRFRLREGHTRLLEASAKCLVALTRQDVIVASKLDTFLAQALGCTREAAHAASVAIQEAAVLTPRERGGETPLPLEELLRAAVSPRRAARRRLSSTPSSSPCKKNASRPGSRAGSRTCTPQRSPSAMVAGIASALTNQAGASPGRVLAMEGLQVNGEKHGGVPGTPPIVACSPPVLPLPSFSPLQQLSRPISFTPTTPYLRTPPRYRQRDSLESPMHIGCTSSSRASAAFRGSEKRGLASAQLSSSWGISPLPPVPPSSRYQSVSRSGVDSCVRDLVVKSTPLPRPLLEQPSSSTPQARPWQTLADAREALHLGDVGKLATTCAATLDDAPPVSFAPAPRTATTNSVTSLAGPRLYGDSQLLSPSCVSLGRDSPTPGRGSAVASLWQSPVPEDMPSFPAITIHAASPLFPNAGHCLERQVTSPNIALFAHEESPPTPAETGDRARNSEMRTPAPWAHAALNPSSPQETSFLVSPPSSSSTRVMGLCTSAAAGLNALEAGGDPTAWHEALRALAAWRPGKDGVRGEAAAEAVVELLLESATRMPDESLPEIWRALSELRGAPWLSEAAVLELAVGQCLSFTEPSVVSAFLVARILDGRLSAATCLDGCLERLCQTEGSPGKRATRLVRLIHTLLEELKSKDLLRDLSLPALPEVVQWTSPKRLAALPDLLPSLELFLRYTSPSCISEACWTQLLHLLGSNRSCHQSSTAVATTHHLVELGSAPSSPSSGRPNEHTESNREWMGSTGHSNADELSTLFCRLHRLTGELSRAKGDEMSSVLQLISQALSQQQVVPPVRAFLLRLFTRQRSSRKENAPPRAGQSPAKDSGGDFVENDYASIRELAHDEGLQGSFPHTLIAHLKRLLARPVAASTRRAGLDCLGALICTSGTLLLRVILQEFVASGILLQAAAVRGPAQTRARAILTQIAFLKDQLDPTSQEDGSSIRDAPRWLRMTSRALLQSLGHRGGSSPAGVSGEPCQFVEFLRWLSEDILAESGCTVGAIDCRELLAVVAPALRDRSTSVRAMAARAIHALACARGDEDRFRDDVHMAPLKASIRTDTLSCLDAGPPPLAPTLSSGVTRTPSIPRSPQAVATALERDLASPNDGSGGLVASSTSRERSRRGSTSRPRRLQFPSPKVERSPVATELAPTVAQTTVISAARMEQHSVANDRVPSVAAVLPRSTSERGDATSETTPSDRATLEDTLSQCMELVRRGAKEPVLLEEALAVARIAKLRFGAEVLQNLSSAAAVACFRAALQALAQLQQLSRSGAPAAQRAAAPLLLELPIVLARIIDHLEAPVQLVAWIRVAVEVLEDGAVAALDGGSGTEGWALRFCARCVDRCAGQLSPGGADFPAWEVLSEVLRFHERHLSGLSALDAGWAADCDIWRRTLDGAARAVSKQYPEQAREFLLLATCTGSPLPEALERIFDEA